MNAEIKGTSPERLTTTTRDEALHAYLTADYARALELLHTMPPGTLGAEDRILEARILLRLGHARGAVASAEAAARLATCTDHSVLAAALRAAALDREGRLHEASYAFRAARDRAPSAHRTVRAELGYFEAVAAWSSGEMLRADLLVERALPEADDVVAALLLQLRGWIEVRRERYAAAAERFSAALCASQRSMYRDLRLEARLIHGLAVIAAETIDLALADRVDRLADDLKWNDGVAREWFNTTTCRRFAAMLRGDMERAYRFGEHAIHIAPTDAFAAIGHTNHAALLHIVGDAFASRYHFGVAHRLIASIAWSNADVEEQVALANYAIEASRFDPPGAAQALTVYRSVSGREKRDLALERDRRVQAFSDLAQGRVTEALGDVERALAAYRRSLRCWIDLGYSMRAAIVACHLLRLSGDDAPRAALTSATSRAPHAWFAAQKHEGPPAMTLPRLTRAQRRVLGHLLAGKASKEIAAALGRSDYTIRNQTKCIFRAFDVRSRAALLVRCQREGITPEFEAAGA